MSAATPAAEAYYRAKIAAEEAAERIVIVATQIDKLGLTEQRQQELHDAVAVTKSREDTRDRALQAWTLMEAQCGRTS